MREHNTASKPPQTFGGYEILSVLGQGGMGIVYEARDPALGRIVALKVLREDLHSRTHLVSRFHREARAIAHLNHPNIVQVFRVGMESGIPYIVMEHINGAPLSAILQAERRLGWERALEIAEQVGRALASAHDAQIIHRDIKPGNVLIEPGGHVYVTDFGIAKILTAETQLTADGSVLGTPQYMCPERCQNVEASAASDIYSLGILVFQMITGRLPFEAPTPVELVRKIVAEAPTRLRELHPDVPEDVERLVAHMIEKKPKDRPSNAHVLCDAIARVRAGQPLDTRGVEVVSALASFRDAMATPTPRPSPNSSPKKRRAKTLSRLWAGPFAAWPRLTGSKTLRRSGLLLIAMTASVISGVLYLSHSAPAAPSESDPEAIQGWQLAAASGDFIEEAPGILLERIHLPGFTVIGSGSIGDGKTLVHLGEASAAGPLPGRSALLTADPARRESIVLLAPPAAAVDSAEYGPIDVLAQYEGVPGVSGPLHSTFLIRYSVHGTTTAERWQRVALWDSSRPTPAFPLLESALGEGNHATVTAAAISPKGTGFILAITAPTGEGALIECEGRTAPEALHPSLTAPGDPIASVVYSSDGLRIAYLRTPAGGPRSLWSTTAGAAVNNGTLLTQGRISIAPSAFGPNGDTLIVGEETAAGGGVLRLLSTTNGEVSAELGEGRVGAWHPTGQFVILSAPDHRGLYQLWALPATDWRKRVQLTFIDAGLAPEFHLSGNGAWAVSTVKEAPEPTLIFVDLSRVAL